MHFILEALWSVLQYLYYTISGTIWACTPAQAVQKDVSGQKVLITGAGSGLGKLMALRFANLGCTLILWDINESANEQTAEEVRRFGVSAHAYICDVSDREEIYNVADQVKQEVGEVDILVNNAGIVTGKTILECSDDMIAKTMDVNATANIWTVKTFLPAMLEKNQGHIVTIASMAGLFGGCGLVDYCASKFAAVGFHEALTMELVKKGKDVKTTVICPYYSSTGMFEGVKTKFPNLLPILDPEDVVDKIMEGILCDSYMVCIPRFFYLLVALKGLMPVKGGGVISTFLGFFNNMDTFRGRLKQD